jgi:hypothetical protein
MSYSPFGVAKKYRLISTQAAQKDLRGEAREQSTSAGVH